MNSNITIRRPIETDEHAILRLVTEMNILHDDPVEGFTMDNVRDDILNPDSPIKTYVAEKSGEVIGFIFYHIAYETGYGGRGFFITDVLIDEKARRQGIAKALITEVARDTTAHGYSFLSWVSMPWNKEAFKFYEKIGAHDYQVNAHVFLEDDLKNLLAE